MTKNHEQPLIPSVAYLRKSTKGEVKDHKTGKKKQRQEKSLEQQQEEVTKMIAGHYRIVEDGWYDDPGVSGTTLDRPGFKKMLERARTRGDFQAILVDNLDRLFRADYDAVHAVAVALKQAGIQWLVTASGGTFYLGRKPSDMSELIKFVIAVCAAHEYSRQLSRRVLLARRNAAEEGKRTGGPTAYALADDGDGGLVPGDPQQIKVLLWLYDQIGNQLRAPNWCAADLNARDIPGPGGGRWFPKTIRCLLRRRCYRGDFEYNRERNGKFFAIDQEGEVIEADELNGKGKVFLTLGVYTPLVPPELFDKVQRRLDMLGANRSRRCHGGYALSGILVCGHCGTPMHGAQIGDQPRVYRCGAPPKKGCACGKRQVREDLIMPFIMQQLGEVIADLQDKLSAPPPELVAPGVHRAEQREKLQRERDRLAAQIVKAEHNLLLADSDAIFKALEPKVTAMRKDLGTLDQQLAAPQPVQDYNRQELAALAKWWSDFNQRAVSVPVKGNLPLVMAFHQDPDSEEQAVLLDPRQVNNALHELGTRVTLWWETRPSKAKVRNRHILARGRFQLGQKSGDLPDKVVGRSA